MSPFFVISGVLLAMGVQGLAQTAGKTGSTTDTAGRQLKEVVVNGARPYITQTADKITINVAQSPLAAGGNAWDIILRTPGITEQNGQMNYTGKTITVLINGRPTALSGAELKNMLSNMPANGIDKVELLPNPSAKYDAQGGSIINIWLLKNQLYGANVNFTAGIGTGRFARANTGLALNYRNKRLYMYGSYDFAYNRQYFNNVSNRVVDPLTDIHESEYDLRTRNNHSYKLGLDYDLNKNTSFGFLLRGSVNFRDRMVTDESVNHPAAGNDSSSMVYTNGYARFMNHSANVYYKKTLNAAGKELYINADYLNYRKIWNDDFATHYLNAVGNEYLAPFILRDASPADNTIRSFTIDYVHPARIGKWEAGLKTAFTTTDNDVLWMQQTGTSWKTDLAKTNHFIYQENINAGYLTFSKTIKQYSLQLGLRGEQTNTKGESVTLDQIDRNSYFNLFPNVALQYAPDKKRQWGFNYRKSIQRFGFDYVNPFIVYHSQYAYSQGNPAIQPMISHGFEFSYSWQSRVFARASWSHLSKVLGPVYRIDPSSNAIVTSYGNLRNANVYVSTLTCVKSLFKGKWSSTNTAGAFYARYSLDAGNSGPNERVTGFFSTNNSFLLSKKLRAELTGFYYSPIASGVYRQQSMFSVNAGITATIIGGKGGLTMNVTDIFNTLIIKNEVLYQQVNVHYNNKAESRIANLVFSYRFGNSKVKANKARKTGIEDERSRMGAN